MVKRLRPQEKLRDKFAETRGNIVEIGHLAKETVQDKYHRLKEQAGSKLDEGKDKLHEVEAGLMRRVRESPIKSVLIAAGVGLVVGYIWRRR